MNLDRRSVLDCGRYLISFLGVLLVFRSRRPLAVLIALLSVVLVLAACDQPSTTGPKPTPGALEGVIVGSLADASGSPVVGQQVVLARADALAAAEVRSLAGDMVITDEFGRFAFDVTEPGTFTLTSVGDSSGVFTTVSVTRGADGQLTSGELELQSLPLGAVSGSVRGQGAGVFAYLAGTSFLALTDDDGDFVISRVPSGTYSVRARVGGMESPAVNVTVPAGESAALSEDLLLGPVITGVSPAGVYFRAETYDPQLEQRGREFVLSGRGFGSSRGASRLYYYTVEVPASAITSWSDTEIRVEMAPLLDFASRSLWHAPRSYELEDLVFEVVTAAGSAVSGPSAPVRFDVYDTGFSWSEFGVGVQLYAQVLEGHPLFDLPVSVSLSSGALVDADGEAFTGPVYVPRDSSPAFFVSSSSDLPAVATLHMDHELAVDSAPFRAVVHGPYVEWANVVNWPRSTIGGALYSPSGEYVPDDGKFALMLAGHPETLTPIVLDEEWGSFIVDIPALDDLFIAYVLLLYDGVPVGGSAVLPR